MQLDLLSKMRDAWTIPPARSQGDVGEEGDDCSQPKIELGGASLGCVWSTTAREARPGSGCDQVCRGRKEFDRRLRRTGEEEEEGERRRGERLLLLARTGLMGERTNQGGSASARGRNPREVQRERQPQRESRSVSARSRWFGSSNLTGGDQLDGERGEAAAAS